MAVKESDRQKLFFLLVADLQVDGPIQKSWRNFSPLGKDLIVYEFVGKNDVLPQIAEGRRHLDSN